MKSFFQMALVVCFISAAVVAGLNAKATGFERSRILVDGEVYNVEMAVTPEERSRGLMFRTELGPDEAMIFPRQGDIASFWMKNTPLPLDIIFIGKDRRIINIAAETTPYSTDPVSAMGPTSAVFEIRGGRAAELGIEPGDTVEW